MAKALNWYSEFGKVFHNNTDCPHGQKIPLKYLHMGTGGLPICEVCKKLNACLQHGRFPRIV
jgi:hypothetical protein